MTRVSLESARLGFKRAFLAYYLELSTPGIADPTAAFATCHLYLGILRERLGSAEFMRRLDDETTHQTAQLEQELRRKFRDRSPQPSYDDLEERVRECFEHGLGRLVGGQTEMSVE